MVAFVLCSVYCVQKSLDLNIENEPQTLLRADTNPNFLHNGPLTFYKNWIDLHTWSLPKAIPSQYGQNWSSKKAKLTLIFTPFQRDFRRTFCYTSNVRRGKYLHTYGVGWPLFFFPFWHTFLWAGLFLPPRLYCAKFLIDYRMGMLKIFLFWYNSPWWMISKYRA